MLDIKDYNPDILDVFSRTVLQMIADGEDGWEEMLPVGISEIIKDHRLFGYSRRRFAQKN